MNKTIIKNAILSAIRLISDELESIEYNELRSDFEMTLVELEQALKEIEKE